MLYIDFRERKVEGEKDKNINDERESSIGCFLHAPHWGSSRQPGMCSDQESNCDTQPLSQACRAENKCVYLKMHKTNTVMGITMIFSNTHYIFMCKIML